MSDVLRCERASVRFGQVTALADASLYAERGEILAILGPSGCGKTTLLRCIAGFQRLDAGEIAVDGRTVESARVHLAPHLRAVGMVFQDFALFPHLSVRDNVGYGLPRGATRKARGEELIEMAGLPGLADRFPHQLSAGQQQRVAIIRSLAPRPALLLLDEPFSNLDPEIHSTLRAQVANLLRENGVTTVLVTHDRADAFAIADRVAVMQSGHVLQVAPPADLYFRPAYLAVARAAGSVQLLAGMVAGGRIATALGDLACLEGSAPGPASALVRPEWIIQSDVGVRAHVETFQVEGAMCRSILRLASGDTVEMLTVTGNGSLQGEVTVRVAVPVPVYPAPAREL